MPALAQELGVARVFVKDESSRLGLPAFKVLGASWAACRVVTTRACAPTAGVDMERLRALIATLSSIQLVTATDGNHGRALARIASLLDLPSAVFVPAVVRPDVASAIAAEGATVTWVNGSYDDAVAAAARAAEQNPAAELVQDTAWNGYEEVPRWIVEGYSTLFREAESQLRQAGVEDLGLVVVPVGVGSLAQAAVTQCRSAGTGMPPAVLGVEPDTAACVVTSLTAGERVSVPTGETIMAGLNCGTPSSLAWPVLRAGMDAGIAVDDAAAEIAVRDLGRLGVSSGPSGAASLAGARAALLGPGSERRRAALGVSLDSAVMLVSTEGAGAATSSEQLVEKT
jgi:diaminopropionate ammonia-lyase